MTYRILSLTGGGIRGVFQAQYLAGLESQLGGSLWSHVDLLTGTSTGAIVALAAALGIPMSRVVELFEDHGRQIFPTLRRRWSRTILGWAFKGPRYDARPLNDLLNNVFKADDEERGTGSRLLRLRDCKTSVVITAMALDNFKIRSFSSFNRCGYPKSLDSELFASDVAMASAAAPLFFPAVRPSGATDDGATYLGQRSYVDGGLWANNPLLFAVISAHRHLGVPFEGMRIVSIGNGEFPQGAVGVEFNKMRRMRMIEPIIEMMFAGQAELADEIASVLVGDLGASGASMMRVNVPLPRMIELDDASAALAVLGGLAEAELGKTGAKVASLLKK